VRPSPTRSLVTAAIVAVGIASVPALTASGEPSANYETRVRISEREPAFHGRVQSTFEQCEKRRVRLVRKGEDANKVMGRDRTDGKGQWKVPVDELTLKSGTYYAWSGRKKMGRKIFVCKADRSRPIVID
jgi:hypothetical protein